MPTFRLLVPLPIIVDGGVTVWKLQAESYGKGHGRIEVIAECLTDGRLFVIADGRETAIARELRLGLTVRPGTMGAKILRKLAREGRAELIT